MLQNRYIMLMLQESGNKKNTWDVQKTRDVNNGMNCQPQVVFSPDFERSINSITLLGMLVSSLEGILPNFFSHTSW